MTKFSFASNRKYTTGAGEQREETEWFNCTAWGKLAETCNRYLTKGRLHSPTYQTQTGESLFINEINLTYVSSWVAPTPTVAPLASPAPTAHLVSNCPFTTFSYRTLLTLHK